MIPDIAKTGSSFKGALAYYLHDKREPGEAERLTSERVAWTETRNLITDDAEVAGRVMAATAMDADRLKREADVRNTGRKSDQHVYAYTLAWHPEERQGLSRAEMVRAADETLRVLGADDRQAIIVCHSDRPHPHVHVIVNRVSPEDGRMLTNGNDRLKLSQWALAYRRERGQEQYCPQRAENWDIRLSRHDEKDRLKYWRAASDTPRAMAEDVKAARDADDPKLAKVLEEQKRKAGKLTADSKAMNERHSREWRELGDGYRDRKAQIYNQAENAIGDAKDHIKAVYRPRWQELGRAHTRQRREFHDREKRLGGKIRNVIDAVTHARRLDPDSSQGVVSAAFAFSTSKEKRMAAVEKAQRADVRALSAEQRAEVGKAIYAIKADRTALLSSARNSFQSERAALIQRQATDKEQMKAAWRRRNVERAGAFKASREAALSKKAARGAQSPQEARDGPAERTAFKKATKAKKGRTGGRSRSRRRKKE